MDETRYQIPKVDSPWNHIPNDVNDLTSRSSTRPVNLLSVTVEGDKSVTNDFLKTQLSPLLANSNFTVDSINKASSNVLTNLEKYGLWDSVKIQFDTDNNSITKSNEPLQLKAIIRAKPKQFDNLSFAGTVADNDGSTILRLLRQNAFNHGEFLNISFLLSNLKQIPNKSYLADLEVPILQSQKLKLRLFSSNTNSMKVDNDFPFSSNRQIQRGVIANFLKFTNPFCFLNVGISGVQRTITDISDGTSDVIKRDVGDSFKASLIGAGTIDTRNSTLFPTKGIYANLEQEYASPNFSSDVNFTKTTLDVKSHQSFLKDFITFSFGLKSGYLTSNSHTLDKFYVSLDDSIKVLDNDIATRTYHQAGQKDGNDYLGGEAFTSFSTDFHMKFPFQLKPLNSPLRLYGFANAVNLQLKSSNALQNLSNIDEYEVSYGAGVAYSSNAAKLKLLYTNFGPRASVTLGFGTSL